MTAELSLKHYLAGVNITYFFFFLRFTGFKTYIHLWGYIFCLCQSLKKTIHVSTHFTGHLFTMWIYNVGCEAVYVVKCGLAATMNADISIVIFGAFHMTTVS